MIEFEKLVTTEDSKDGLSECFVATVNGKEFFLKRLKSEYYANHILRNSYKKEFQLGKNINHPNIVRYEQFSDDESGCQILMEHICGCTLKDMLLKSPEYFASKSNIKKFLNELLSGLKCLHENDIVYSDMKPENIMITQVGNHVKIIDLGFCFTDAYSNTTGMTELYAAPEHCNITQIDEQTDIYGVGKILEYIDGRASEELPRQYKQIMMRCLQEKKKDRYASIDDIIRIINRQAHLMRKSLIAIGIVAMCYIGFCLLRQSEAVNSWMNKIELLPRDIKYDIEYKEAYYRVFQTARWKLLARMHFPISVYHHG